MRVRRGFTSGLIALFLVAYVGLGLSTEFQFIGTHSLPGTLLEDFGFYLRAFFDATAGRDPYAIRNIGPAFLYPPPALFVVGLFARFTMPLETAAAYIAVNLSLLAILVWGVARRFNYGIDRVWWWFPLAFGFGPVLEDLHIGQINLVTEFGTFLLFAFEGAAPMLAGFGLSLAALTKVTPLLFILYLVGTRNRPTLLASLAWIIFGLAASGLAFGWRHLVSYADVFHSLSGVFLPGDGNTQGLLSVLDYHKLIAPVDAPADQKWLTTFFTIVVILTVALGLGFRQRRQMFVVVALVATISPNVMWYHHWVFLLLPVFVLIGESKFHPAVVVWCVAGLTLIQMDRFGLGHGLVAQAFAYLTLMGVLLVQAVDARRQVGNPIRREELAREFGKVQVAVDWAVQYLAEAPDSANSEGMVDVATPSAKFSGERRHQLGASVLVVAAIALGAWLRVHGALVAGDVADVATYRNHVEILRHGDSVYRQAAVYPYFPGWLDLEWASWLASQFLQYPFGLTIRLLVISADVLTSFALWWTATLLQGPTRGRWVAVIYALNPIAIVISGYHGQFDALPTLLAVVAFGLLARGASSVGAGLLIGAGIAIKPHPTLVVAVFARDRKLSPYQRLILVATIGVVLGAIIVASSGVEAPRVIQNVIGYGGGNDQGIGGLLRGLWLYRANNLFLPGDFGITLEKNSRWLAIALMGLTWLLTWKQSVARSTAAVFLAFLAVFGSISTQYFLWPVAWLLVSDVALVWSVAYGVGVTAGAIGYYLVYWPPIILGSAGSGGPWPAFALTYVEGEIVSWATILIVYFVTIGRPRSAGWWWRPLVIVGSIAVLVTAYPVITQVVWLADQWINWRA